MAEEIIESTRAAEEASSEPIAHDPTRTGEGVGNERDEWRYDPSREDWGYSWITEGMNGVGNKREGPKASRAALLESQSGPRALSISPLLRPARRSPRHVRSTPHPPVPEGNRQKPQSQPELLEECGQL